MKLVSRLFVTICCMSPARRPSSAQPDAAALSSKHLIVSTWTVHHWFVNTAFES